MDWKCGSCFNELGVLLSNSYKLSGYLLLFSSLHYVLMYVMGTCVVCLTAHDGGISEAKSQGGIIYSTVSVIAYFKRCVVQTESPPFQSPVRWWPEIEPTSSWAHVYSMNARGIIQKRDVGQETRSDGRVSYAFGCRGHLWRHEFRMVQCGLQTSVQHMKHLSDSCNQSVWLKLGRAPQSSSDGHPGRLSLGLDHQSLFSKQTRI